MNEVKVPRTDVNSEDGVVVDWKVTEGARVRIDDVVAEVETTKAIIEVTAGFDGFILPLVDIGAEFSLELPIALVFDDSATLKAEARVRRERIDQAPQSAGPRATHRAHARARALGIDLETFGDSRLITAVMVEAAAETRKPFEPESVPALLAGSRGRRRVLILGGGRGANQVIDIFEDDSEHEPVGILDDDPARWGQHVSGVPIVGPMDRLASLFEAGLFDRAIVSISKTTQIRADLRARCVAGGVPLANAIDSTCKISRSAVIGQGNVLCAFCHVGAETVLGENNFLSAFNSIDHHNVVGNDVCTGPNCVTSSRVVLEDKVRLGTGIFMEPGVRLGEGVQVASGSVLVRSVPAYHAVKTRVVTTKVVPLKR